MICAVHALIGAALGSFSSSRKRAFVSGLLSHLLADLVPHRDFSVKTEALLVFSVLGLIAARRGWNSPEFWGAVGAALPDVENALTNSGEKGRNYFPTHTGRLHGPKVDELFSQTGLALICLAILIRREARPDQ